MTDGREEALAELDAATKKLDEITRQLIHARDEYEAAYKEYCELRDKQKEIKEQRHWLERELFPTP